VRSIAEAVEERLGRGSVFLDEWFEYYIAGSDVDTRLQEIYGQKTELVIVSVSANYGGKPWTLAEHAAIRALYMQLSASKDKKDAFRILPLRTGDGDVKGIFSTSVPDVRQRPVAQTAELIVNRLRLIVPDAKLADTFRQTIPDAQVSATYLPETAGPSLAPRQRQVFVSYSTKDLSFVETVVVPTIRTAGFSPWYSLDSIRAADLWERSVLKGLQTSEIFVVVMSLNAVNSQWVRSEVHWATQKREHRIIPLMISDCDPYDLHMRLGNVQYIDFRLNHREAKNKLLKLLQNAP